MLEINERRITELTAGMPPAAAAQLRLEILEALAVTEPSVRRLFAAGKIPARRPRPTT